MFLFFVTAGSLAASVRVIESSSSRLVFRWELGSFDTLSFNDSGGLVTGLAFSGSNITLGSEGQPVIPGVSVYVGVPVSGAIRVNFVPGSVSTITLNHPLRKNRMEGDKVFPLPREIPFPNGWLSDPRHTWFKGMRAAQLIIRPFRYEVNSRTVQVLNGAECTVEFPAAAPLYGTRPALTDYQRMLQGLVLNYQVAAGWVKPLQKKLRKTADFFPLSYGQPLLTFTIGDGHAGTNAYTLKENVILKISGSQIKRLFAAWTGSVDTSAISMRSVALYASWKGELPITCPAYDSIPAGITEVPLFRCDRNENDTLDNDDYVLAYVSGLSDWSYDTTAHDYVFRLDNYDDNRHYWLTLKTLGAGNGASITRFVQPSGSTGTFDYGTGHAMVGGLEFPPSSIGNANAINPELVVGYVWKRLLPYTPVFQDTLELPYSDTASGGFIRFGNYSSTDAEIKVLVSDDTISTHCSAGANYPVRHWGNRVLRMVYSDTSSSLHCWQLVNVRADYRHVLSARADSALRMSAFSFTESDIKSYRFSSTGSGRIFLFRIPVDESAVTLIDTIAGGAPYVWTDSGNTGVRYFLCNDAGFVTLPDAAFLSPPARLSGSSYDVANLRDAANTADYLIITPPAFAAEAERLAAHKASRGFTRPCIVSINDVYTDFAGGNFDPVALRNFLAFATRNWQNGGALDYVVFVGCGHYDYKRIYTVEENFIPPWEQDGTTCVDDFYAALTPGYFGSGSSDLSVAIGRLPCQTNGEAKAMVDKIIAVENEQSADWGPWRNTMVLVADDDMQGSSCDGICPPGNNGHHISSEYVAQDVEQCRPSMNLQKVYLFDYPWNSSHEKPEASRAIVNSINNGTAYVNFFGHGSDVYWTDEHVLQATVVSQLVNRNHYPLISSFSCSVGRFDMPDNTSLSEVLAKASSAGALATFSGTRGAMPGPNESLSRNLHRSLFDSLGATLGMAVLDAKFCVGGTSNSNSNVYVLFGDPSVRFVKVCRRVELRLYDMNNTPLNDTLRAMQQITIRGTVVDENGAVDGNFGTSSSQAFVRLGIFNPPDETGRQDGGTCDIDMATGKHTVRWMRPGKPLFYATIAVRNGLFEQTAILPPSITFDKVGAKLTAYAWQGSTAGLGCLNSLIFHGTCTSCSPGNDTTGPRITLRPIYDAASMNSGSVSFSDHIVSSLPLKCEIVLADESGINVVDNGPDQGLTMEIPGIISRCNINYKFQFVEGDYRKGCAPLSFEENTLPAGNNNLLVTAQDLLGNVSRGKFVLEITDENTLLLDHVFNTPNPVRMGETTRFFFYPSTTTTYASGKFIIVIKIYSLGGRLLRVIKNASNGEVWDCRDQTGYPLPPNIYLYQVTADYPSQEKMIKSKIQKLVIHPPRK
jgi:hypothetical protein